VTLRPEALYPAGTGAPPYPLIDVRSPVEVSRGALPHAHALPLMTDEERHLVGLRYRDAGQEAAIALGYELAGPYLGERTAAWRAVSDGPVAVTCWRGGLRSRLAVEMIVRPTARAVEGGYKAVRAHLLARLPERLACRRLVVLTGLTGSGKTELLRDLAGATETLQAIDLEGIARHRGSAFGAQIEPQPSQATFENEIAAALLLHAGTTAVVEDESPFVGRLRVPSPLLEAMRNAPVIVLEVPRAVRVRRVYEEYVLGAAAREGVPAALQRLESATNRLRGRLGGARSDAIIADLRAAEPVWDDPDAHEAWITRLLEDHYDRLYRRALAKHGRLVLMRGDAGEVRDALMALAL
jgi:tRNA 2-selenouridine synthase